MLRFCAPQALMLRVQRVQCSDERAFLIYAAAGTFYRCVLRCVTALFLITATSLDQAIQPYSLSPTQGEAKAKSVTAPAGKAVRRQQRFK